MHQGTIRWAAFALVAYFAGCRGGSEPNVPSNEAKTSMRPLESAPASERVVTTPTTATSSTARSHPHVATSPPGLDTPPASNAAPYEPGNPLPPAPTATGGGPKLDRGGSIYGDETKGSTGAIPAGPK